MQAAKLSSMQIETERLQLRPWTMADVDELVALHADPEVAEFVHPLDRQGVIERLDTDQRDWVQRGHGQMAIVDRHGGGFLGRVGLKYWPQFSETEIGWVLRRDAWGKGFATEAARACASWGFRELPVPYLTAMIRPDNGRSIEVAKRLTMTPLRTDVLARVPVVVYAINREDWTPAASRDEAG